MKPPFVRNPYNYDVDKASDESGLSCPEPTLTQQSFEEESNINYIAEKFGLTGELPQVLNLPRYGDFNGIFDFQTAQNAVVEANRQFMTLPAKIRSRFNNDPQQLLAFLEDDENRKEAEFLGLVEPRQEPPQSRLDDATPKDKGERPSPKDDVAAPSTPKPDKKSKTDT